MCNVSITVLIFFIPEQAEINIPTITLDIPKVQLPAFLADGEYWLQIKASSGAEQIACFSTTIAVKAT